MTIYILILTTENAPRAYAFKSPVPRAIFALKLRQDPKFDENVYHIDYDESVLNPDPTDFYLGD